jgi:exodeoxyribonuclease-3
MRIISWNVNGLRANVKKGGFDWFINESPDIYCIQETKSRPDQLEHGVLNPQGYHSYFDHSKLRQGYSGVAVYSKIKPNKIEYGLGKEELDQEGRFLALFFDDFLLINTYIPNGGGGPERLKYKLEYYDYFLKYIEKHRKSGLNIIFCGDINTAHAEIDLARPKENQENTGFLPIERAWIDNVIEHGYVDIFRNLHPEKVGAYSYWDMKTFARERNVGWRIDYFFINKEIVKKVKDCKILENIMGSDHCPIELKIEL